jgi:hypothetical protein
MSDQGDSSLEFSASPSSLASDLSERDFHASDVESFVGSDVSHLLLISDLEGLSESDSEASHKFLEIRPPLKGVLRHLI